MTSLDKCAIKTLALQLCKISAPSTRIVSLRNRDVQAITPICVGARRCPATGFLCERLHLHSLGHLAGSATDRALRADPAFAGVSGPLNPNGAPLTPAQLARAHAALGPAAALSPVAPARLPVSTRLCRAASGCARIGRRDGGYGEGVTAWSPRRT